MFEFEGEPPRIDEGRPLDPRKTLIKAVGFLIMLLIAICGMVYAGHDIWTNYKK